MGVDNRRGFFEFILGPEPGYLRVVFLNARTRHWQEQFYSYPDALDDVLDDIDANVLTSNVYFCPTLYVEPKGTKENITHSRV